MENEVAAAETPQAPDVMSDVLSDDRASLLAELNALPEEEGEAQPAEETEPAEGAEKEPEPDKDDEEPEKEPEPEEAAPEPEAAEDAVRDKRIAAIKEEERAARARMDEHFAAKERELEQKWSDKARAAQEYEANAARARANPVAVLESLGIRGDDLEAAARSLYAASPAGSKNPALRDAAERAQQARMHGDELSQTRQELAALKAMVEQQTVERHVGKYIDEVTSAATDDTPAVRNFISKNPARARQVLREEAEKLTNEFGEVPTPEQLLRHYEKKKRAELEELGIDPSVVFGKKPAATTKPQTPAAGEKETAKTMSNDITTTTTPRTEPQTEEEERAELLKALEAL